MEMSITSPEERTFCAKGCGTPLVHMVGRKRAYPDLCTGCERELIEWMKKRGGRLSHFAKEKLKK